MTDFFFLFLLLLKVSAKTLNYTSFSSRLYSLSSSLLTALKGGPDLCKFDALFIRQISELREREIGFARKQLIIWNTNRPSRMPACCCLTYQWLVLTGFLGSRLIWLLAWRMLLTSPISCKLYVAYNLLT